MIHVKRSPAPPIFKSAEWQHAQDDITRFFQQKPEERSQHHFVFKFHKHPLVRKALEELFQGKCAFCESSYASVAVMAVENFRPKGGAMGMDGKLDHDHYWWLAYEWFNLYPACPDCNRSKGSRFPVEGKRAPIGATEDELRKERALLLDPCVDHPECELTFNDKGLVASDTDRGRKTIDTYNLNRQTLVIRRRKHVAALREQWQRVTSALKKRNPKELDRELTLLKSLVAPQFEFIAMSRSCLQQWAVEFCNVHPEFTSSLDSVLTLQTAFTPEADAGTRRSKLEPLLNKTKTKGKTQASADVKSHVSQTVKDFQVHEAAQSNYSLANKSEREKFFASTRVIESIEIKNFKIIKQLRLTFTPTTDAGSWLLILGENGTGKSSVLNAVALALMGEKERHRLGLNDGSQLATYPRKEGQLVEGFVEVRLTGGGDPVRIDFRSDSSVIASNAPDPKVLLLGYSATRLLPHKHSRTTQGSKYSKTDNLFNPSLALTKSAQWLHSLDAKTFDDVCASLKRIMMLDERDYFSKTENGRIMVNAFGGAMVYLEDLSAGYQSVVALATDIMSVLLNVWESVRVAEGIVLIDEIDAHLHPRWKMQIVERLRETFPRLQFLVTSHEPLSLRGLNQQEVAVMIRSKQGRVTTITENLPNPKALRVDQLLTSEFFGLSCTLSPDLEMDFNEYYSLLAKPRRTNKQGRRVTELKTKLDGLRLMGDTPRERMMYEVIDEFLARKAERPPDIDKLETKTRKKLLRLWERMS